MKFWTFPFLSDMASFAQRWTFWPVQDCTSESQPEPPVTEAKPGERSRMAQFGWLGVTFFHVSETLKPELCQGIIPNGCICMNVIHILCAIFSKLNHVHIWLDGSSTCVSFLKVCVAWWYSYNWLPPVRVTADVDCFDTHIFSEGIGEVFFFCFTLNTNLLWSSELMTLNTSVGFSRWPFPWLPLAWWLGLTWIPRYQLFLPSSGGNLQIRAFDNQRRFAPKHPGGQERMTCCYQCMRRLRLRLSWVAFPESVHDQMWGEHLTNLETAGRGIFFLGRKGRQILETEDLSSCRFLHGAGDGKFSVSILRKFG